MRGWRGGRCDTELAKKTQNPVADLISAPFQNNFNFSPGPKDATIYVLNVQPVIPLKLTEDWNLTTRPSCPSSTSRRCSRRRAPSGWGTSTPRSSCRRRSPASSSGGVGPTFTLPTATDSRLGSSQWSMGPAAVDGEHTVVSWRHEAIP
jgi:hypothetical protein